MRRVETGSGLPFAKKSQMLSEEGASPKYPGKPGPESPVPGGNRIFPDDDFMTGSIVRGV